MPPHLPSRGRAQQHCLLIGRMGGDVLERLTCHYNTPARLVCCTPPRGSGVACRRICCFGSESHAAATPRPVCADTHRRAGAGWLAAGFVVSEASPAPSQCRRPLGRIYTAAQERVACRRICRFGSDSIATTTPQPVYADARRRVGADSLPPDLLFRKRVPRHHNTPAHLEGCPPPCESEGHASESPSSFQQSRPSAHIHFLSGLRPPPLASLSPALHRHSTPRK